MNMLFIYFLFIQCFSSLCTTFCCDYANFPQCGTNKGILFCPTIRTNTICAGCVGICWWRRYQWPGSTSPRCCLASCPSTWCPSWAPGTFARPPRSAGTGGSSLSRWGNVCGDDLWPLTFNCPLSLFTSLASSSPPVPGLRVGQPLPQEGLVPPLRAGREGVWSLEEPLRLLPGQPGLANATGGRPHLRHPQPGQRRAGWGGRGEKERDEDQADDPGETAGGEEWVRAVFFNLSEPRHILHSEINPMAHHKSKNET